jgi:hypothetical protein
MSQNKILVMVPDGTETKNYCAGEGQKQFNRPTSVSRVERSEVSQSHETKCEHESRGTWNQEWIC